jgi:ATP-dependent DNA helicase DinG
MAESTLTSQDEDHRRVEGPSAREVSELLGPEGPLAQTLPEFELRESQVEMAAAVANVFREGGELLVEAGTGTGKTLAYLIPAVLSGRRVVISTGTKNLQEQLFYKDIPLVRKALRKDFSACLMKGRSNYLCRLRFDEFAAQPTFRFFAEAGHFETLVQWARVTKNGDRADIPGFPENIEFWTKISARSENCVGRDCRHFDNCYVTRLRQRAADSQIIVVNHHLLFADLMIREGSYGEVLPEYDYLVVDEAHQVEAVATQYFGAAVSNVRVEELVRDTEAAWKERKQLGGKRKQELRDLRLCSQTFFELYRDRKDRYRIGGDGEPRQRLRAYEDLRKQVERVGVGLKAIPGPDETTVALCRRSAEIVFDLERILSASDPESVSWCESRERSVVLRSSPINVSDLVRRFLLDPRQAVVLTSATLAVEGSCDYITKQLGVEPREEKVLPSPFDFERQTVLYIPNRMPAPRDPCFTEKASEEILALTRASRGRAFVLFTSFANLRAVRARVEDRLDYPLLVQGEAPRSELLERFKTTPGAVLLATSSFWEGVDVVGEQLSCVIIDKLPFAVPADPLVSARIDFVEKSGGNGFQDFQVPMAILGLKQGLGRLIRSKTDRGVLAILDSRLLRMNYGRRFLSSLPPCPLTHDRQDVTGFFEERQS